jgi:polysaccharide pyruvyl transferase WcaK-like protein
MALRITIHGSYGTGNRGDNCILIQLLRFLEQEAPRSEVTVLCRDEERLGALLAKEMPDSNLQLRTLHHSFKRRGLAVLKACMGCDLFILGGGGLLWGKASGNLGYWLLRPRLALLAGRKLVFYAPGIYDIRGGRAQRLLGNVAKKAHFLSVRDREGLQELMRAGVSEDRIVLGADPAFLLPPADYEAGQALMENLRIQEGRRIALSARDWKGRLSAGLFARFVLTLLEDSTTTLIFFPFKTGGLASDTDRNDAEVGRRLLLTLPKEFQHRIVLLGNDLRSEDYINLMSHCDVLIGMRLHSLIFATLAGTPFGALPYDRKIETYMEMLGRKDRLMGTKEFSLKDNQEDLLARLEAERDNLPEGPVVSILMAGAELAGRARAMHAELSRRLREWFPDA